MKQILIFLLLLTNCGIEYNKSKDKNSFHIKNLIIDKDYIDNPQKLRPDINTKELYFQELVPFSWEIAESIRKDDLHEFFGLLSEEFKTILFKKQCKKLKRCSNDRAKVIDEIIKDVFSSDNKRRDHDATGFRYLFNKDNPESIAMDTYKKYEEEHYMGVIEIDNERIWTIRFSIGLFNDKWPKPFSDSGMITYHYFIVYKKDERPKIDSIYDYSGDHIPQRIEE
ncbi:MAG: hypothetical protein SFU98_06290 [Leptospiraceae bacterium]|nr:hypothetical protein [Leptospiraceae bacterium]